MFCVGSEYEAKRRKREDDTIFNLEKSSVFDAINGNWLRCFVAANGQLVLLLFKFFT